MNKLSQVNKCTIIDQDERPPPILPRPSTTFVTFNAQTNLQSSSEQQQQASDEPTQQAEDQNAYAVIADGCNSSALYSVEDDKNLKLPRPNDVISLEPEVGEAMINRQCSVSQWLLAVKLRIKLVFCVLLRVVITHSKFKLDAQRCLQSEHNFKRPA